MGSERIDGGIEDFFCLMSEKELTGVYSRDALSLRLNYLYSIIQTKMLYTTHLRKMTHSEASISVSAWSFFVNIITCLGEVPEYSNWISENTWDLGGLLPIVRNCFRFYMKKVLLREDRIAKLDFMKGKIGKIDLFTKNTETVYETGVERIEFLALHMATEDFAFEGSFASFASDITPAQLSNVALAYVSSELGIDIARVLIEHIYKIPYAEPAFEMIRGR